MAGGSDNVFGVRFAIDASGTDADSDTGRGRGRSYRHDTPAPATSTGGTEDVEPRNKQDNESSDDQHHGGVQGGDDSASNKELDRKAIDAFYGLDFAFASANVTPHSFHIRRAGQRVARGAYISPAKNATREAEPGKGKFAWYTLPDYATSADFQFWAAKEGLPELAPHALFLFGNTRLMGISGALSEETLSEQHWFGALAGELFTRAKSFCAKKDDLSKDVVETHAEAMAALKLFGVTNNIHKPTMR